MSEILEEVKYRGCTIKVCQDQDPANPMEDWDGMGEIRSFSRRHANNVKSQEEAEQLMKDNPFHVELSYFEHGQSYWMVGGEMKPGMEGDFRWDGVRRAGLWIPDKEALATIRIRAMKRLLPEGSDVKYETHDGKLNDIVAVFPDGTKRYGYKSFEKAYQAIARKTKTCLNKMALVPAMEEEAVDLCRSCIETYNQYCNGEVYGYITEGPDGEDIDSCWGFYGWDDRKNDMMDQARSSIDHWLKDRLASHLTKLRTHITNKVPLNYREAAPAMPRA